jgi:segregation and condensation protein B
MLNLFSPAGGLSPSAPPGGPPQSSAASSGWQWNLRIRKSDSQPIAAIEQAVTTVRSAKLQRLEAVLMVADGPLSLRKLSRFATLADNAEARQLIQELNKAYDHRGCAFRVERVATGHQLLTQRRFAYWLDRLYQRQAALRLSPAAMETLTIVAYRQPTTRADVEAVRGVQSSEMLKQLLERKLIRIAGEDDSLGRPYLYGTTRQFLEVFGMHSLDDLPMANNLRQPAKSNSASPTGLLNPPEQEAQLDEDEDEDEDPTDELDDCDEDDDEDEDDAQDFDDYDDEDYEDAA